MPKLFSTNAGRVILITRQVQVLTPDLVSTGYSFPFPHGNVAGMSPDGTTLALWTGPGKTTLVDAHSFKPGVTLDMAAPLSVSSSAALDTNTIWKGNYPSLTVFVTRTDVTGSKLIFHDGCTSGAYYLSPDRILANGCEAVKTLRVIDDEGKIVVSRDNAEGAYTFAGVSEAGTRFAMQAYDELGDPSSLIFERFFIYDARTATPLASVRVDDLPERQSWTAFSPDGRFFAVGNPNRVSLYEVP